MIFFVIAAIIGIYTLTLGFNRLIGSKINVSICPICAAVFSTWVALLLLWFFDIGNELLIGILSGQSIFGLMHLFEKRWQQRKMGALWSIQLSTVIAGTLTIFFLLSKFWLGSLMVILIFVILFSFLYQNRGKRGEKKGNINKAVQKLESELEKCCD